jgi:HTH-type transcriptional dual regulator CecR, C-terminal domain
VEPGTRLKPSRGAILGVDMSLGTSTPSGHTQLELIGTAIQLFSIRRFDEVEMHEILDSAGVGSCRDATHYGGKADIYAAALWVACRRVGQLAKYLPEPPGIRDREAPQKAADALRAHIRMLLSLSLGRVPDEVPEPFQDQERTNVLMVIREVSSPRVGLASHLLEAVGPFADHLAQCVRALRPDLDAEAVFRMGLSIHGQILFLNCNTAMVPLLRDQPYLDGDLESLTEHYFTFCLNGIAA